MCAQKASASDQPAAQPRRAARSAPAPADAASASDTRLRVIEAALSCILERGFYRASTNAIAERAGLTWGVIQYYFGTREALMMAVLEEASRRLTETLSSAEITGEDLTRRVERFYDILAGYYGSPDYLAFIQVQVNLAHDPRTSEQARQTLIEISERANPELRRLMAKVIGTKRRGKRPENIANLLFHALRGVSMSHVMLGTIPEYADKPPGDFPAERKLLARAMSLLIEQELGS